MRKLVFKIGNSNFFIPDLLKILKYIYICFCLIFTFNSINIQPENLWNIKYFNPNAVVAYCLLP